jgi:phage repressor protein C with HTH and peptisase S24 domain
LPGIDVAENILPVFGMSMEPEISNGAIIGVRKMNNWESLNTERVYMIITHEDRMIKRIEPDSENEEVLWCVSPNYPKFKVFKSDIIEIQRVCFVYNPK